MLWQEGECQKVVDSITSSQLFRCQGHIELFNLDV